jgi:hypothetical protein
VRPKLHAARPERASYADGRPEIEAEIMNLKVKVRGGAVRVRGVRWLT